jgi:hypothetical protein
MLPNESGLLLTLPNESGLLLTLPKESGFMLFIYLSFVLVFITVELRFKMRELGQN